MTELLVSVRSAAEAEAALAGGAGLIDVKEPERGLLGRADEATITAVVRAVAGRRPVSAALGELAEPRPAPLVAGLSYGKWGLSGAEGNDWRGDLLRAAQRLPSACRPVAVAYADHGRAAAPSPAEVCAFACERRWGAFLLDTWRKDGLTLLDWHSFRELSELSERCRRADVPVALAGSLGIEQIRALRPVRPDWFAVRGAACREGQRRSAIDGDRVRRLVDLLGEPITDATGAG